jgi:GrpB-like predicted nucleotidyltransferase (UPF0157 family)
MTGIDEPIHLSNYDVRWPTQFVVEAARLQKELPSNVIVEHIGSTAVPGLCAKPVIDIMVGAEPDSSWKEIGQRLTALGYEDMGEAGVPGRVYFRIRTGTAFNIALVTRNGTHWNNNLTLRDYLRIHADQAREYADVKRTAVADGANSLLAYSERKSDAIVRLIRKALEWVDEGPA